MPPDSSLRRLILCQSTAALALVSWLLLDRGLLFSALGADQSQEIFGVKGVQASGLLPGGAQGDVHTAIVGEDHHPQIVQHFLPVGRSQVRILRYEFLCLLGSQLILFAKRPSVKVVRGHAVLHQEVLSTIDAPLRESLVVFFRATWVCMATENEVGIRLVSQIALEVRSQGFQDFCLAVKQASLGILGGGPSRLKVNTMQGKFGFQLLDLWGRRRRRWRRRSLDVHHGGGGGGERRAAVVAYVASDGDSA